MKILVINSGSSSIKYQLFNMDTEEVLCSGLVERIGLEMGKISYKKFPDSENEKKIVIEMPFPSHKEGMYKVVEMLTDKAEGVISDVKEIHGVGHRIVHGGSYSEPVVVDDEVKKELRNVIPLAPLHNPGHLVGIEVAEQLFPHATHVTVFDTAFHMTMPPKSYMYPLPYSLYEDLKVRRYGFHGTSHKYVSHRAAEIMEKPYENLNMITVHLGNGSSVDAIQKGKCIDTSMGLAPLEGLMMGSRCGDIDPAIIGYVMRNKNLSIDEIDVMLTKQSGLLGICGYTDMRDIHAEIEKGNEKAKLALEMLCHRIKKYIGAYFAELGKIDALIFTAGIGENDEIVRRLSTAGLEELGIEIDLEENDKRPKEWALISKPTSKVKVYVIRTNEELEIAHETLKFL
ncbi:MAG: acetate kinase [Alphaproteobacteria bacterium]|nr:acetate kinase [Alphaproteobacteria bacterium]